jgi:Tol biopolymer transport system component
MRIHAQTSPPAALEPMRWGEVQRRPRQSPDGSMLAFLCGHLDDAPQVHLVDSAGGEPRLLTHLLSGATEIEWSPDSTRLLAHCAVPVNPAGDASRDKANHLFVLDVQTGHATRVTYGPGVRGNARWSPDGKRIAYLAGSELRIVNADGSGERALANGLEDAPQFEWSRDGRSVELARGPRFPVNDS